MTEGDNATLRDVFDAVGDTRREVISRIDSLSDRVDRSITDHERRITTVEQQQRTLTLHSEAVDSRLNEHGKDIGHIKDQQRADEVVAAASSGRWTRRHTLYATLGTFVLAAAAVLSLIIH